MTEQRKFPWLAVLLGVGCVGVLCVGVLVAGGGAALFLTQRSASPSMPEPVVTEVIVTRESLPTATPPVPTSAPAPTDSGLSLTGNQHVDEHSLYDDFSSEALGWPIYDDGITIIQYEDEAYSFQIAEPDYENWVYFPVDFIPYEIWFDVQGLDGPQDGTFGVFCQEQDDDNFYYIEFDLEINTYAIGQVLNGEDVPLTPENPDGLHLWETDAFESSPTSVNRIGIGCYLDSITLFINDQYVDEVSVAQPFDQPGEAAFFVYAFDFAGPEGYKVFFDNVETWQPVQ